MNSSKSKRKHQAKSEASASLFSYLIQSDGQRELYRQHGSVYRGVYAFGFALTQMRTQLICRTPHFFLAFVQAAE